MEEVRALSQMTDSENDAAGWCTVDGDIKKDFRHVEVESNLKIDTTSIN